jgi:nitrogen fixation/metabolism regulation signal transduction histidine kinase
MPASFRSRLFRLFLLFAIVPSIVLTVIGYYLAVDNAATTESSRPERSDLIQDYFFTLLYDDIERTLADYRAESGTFDATLDFAIRIDSMTGDATVLSGNVSPYAISRLKEVLQTQNRGLVALDDRFLQFVSTKEDAQKWLVGGIMHDSSFVNILEGARLISGTRSAERELRSRYIVFLGMLFLSVMLVALVGAYLLSARVSGHLAKPVIALSRAAAQIAGGDFRQQVSVSARDELGTLVESFNLMAAQLDRITAQLAQTERVAAWRQVARRFAHELKNPLQPILVSLYRMEQQLTNTDQWEQVREPLQAAGEEVKHLTSLAERFSTLAKLPPPKLERLNISDLVQSVFQLYIEELRPFEPRLDLPPETAWVVTDAAYVREAIHNLLQNAIDACREGDRISVTLAQNETSATIVVIDTGTGMDEKTLASARLPYFTTKAKGNGLGLAIVEKSMAELGGQLRVESKPGRGTTVTLVLPLREQTCLREF